MEPQQEAAIELFCGPEKPFSNIATFLGYKTFTFDLDVRSGADLTGAASEIDLTRFPSAPAMVWMAPPSDGFDDAKGWEDHSPVTPAATNAEQTLREGLRLAREMRPKWWFIEAPKSHLRKLSLMAGFNRGDPSRIRYTIVPKNYGETGKREIDVWTNAFWWVPLTRSDSAPLPDGERSSNPNRVPPSVYLEMLNQYDTYLRNKGER